MFGNLFKVIPLLVQALESAAEFRLNRSLLNSVAASSCVLSGVCMCLIAFTAWSRDLVPIFTSLTVAQASTFPLLDQCVVMLVLLTAAAVFVPRLLVRKVVKMTVSAEDFLKHSQRAKEPQAKEPQGPEPPQQIPPSAAGAVATRKVSAHAPAVKFAAPAPIIRNRGAMVAHQQRSFQRCKTVKL